MTQNFDHVFSTLGELDRGDAGFLYRQLSARIRSLIANGVLAPGTKLPSSRVLSRRLAISRNSVATAFDALTADGWLEARSGSGTYVARTPPVSLTPAQRRAVRVRNAPAEIPFAVGPIAVDLFPIHEWRKIQTRCWSQMSREALLDQHPAGWADLREAICAHVAITRGVVCTPEQVFVNSSARMCIDLSVRALGLMGENVWLEDPGFHRTDGHLTSMVHPVNVQVDEDGLDVADGLRRCPGAAAAIVTPTGQFPTGAALSGVRRQGLLDWAKARGSWIIEDDYESEFAFEGRPAPTLFSERQNGRVIYVGTFNKVMFPALRLAYLVAPDHAVDRFMEATERLGDYPSIPNQVVLAEFIERGGFDRHQARCRKAYAERREILLGADLGPGARFEPHRFGLHVLMTADGRGSRDLEATCREGGAHAVGVHRFRGAAEDDHRLMLGFAGFGPGQLRVGIERLQRALRA